MGKRVRPVCGFVATAATACTLTTSAEAEEARQQRALVLVHIQSSDPCFDQAQFLRDLRSRLPESQVELTQGNAHAEVQIVRHEQSYQAELVLHSPGTPSRRRTISSPTCDEAMQGIAFITGVALDEQPRPAEQSPKSPLKLSSVPQETWEGRIALGAQLAVAALPKTTFGPQLSVHWGRRSPGWWSPGAELGFILLPPVEVTEAAGVARFSLWYVTLDLCPTQARVRAFWLRPCAYGTAGRLRSEGKETENGQLSRRPYLTAGAELVLGVDMGRWIDLVVRGSWSASLIVDSYQFNDEIFYEQEPFSYGLGAQLSVTLF